MGKALDKKRAKHIGHVNRIARELGASRGHVNERRVIEAFASILATDARPPWLIDIIPTSIELDRQGIDLLCRTTDLGNLKLQVKSSQSGRKRFEMQRRMLWQLGKELHVIGVIIVHPGQSVPDLRREVYAVIKELRTYVKMNGDIIPAVDATPHDPNQ